MSDTESEQRAANDEDVADNGNAAAGATPGGDPGDAPETSATGDPFEGWPQPAGAIAVEDTPAEGVSVEHVRGEIEVPTGYTVIEGTPTGRRR